VKVAVLTLLAALGVAVTAGSAGADFAALRPVDLRVAGGEDSWHADNDFRLDWDNPQSNGRDLPVEAVHFQVRDWGGHVVVPEARLPGTTNPITKVHVPAGPGRYQAEVWLEGTFGRTGPPAVATLLFDDRRPGPTRPLTFSGWLAGDAVATAKLEHPGDQPVSGIRGYAVSVGRGGGIDPCAGADRCSVAETDLRTGVGGDTISLGVLPEGLQLVRAVTVSGSGVRSTETSAVIRVDATDPETTLSGIPRGWADGPVALAAMAADTLSGMAADGPSGPFTAIAVDGAVPRSEPGGSATAIVSGSGSHHIAFYARDAAGNVDDGSPRVAWVRIDESPPVVSFPRSQDPAEPERIEALVSDLLSGVDPARGAIAVRPAHSRLRFERLPTSFPAGRLVAHWDSDAFAPGSYEFRATAYDAAGNAASTERRGNGARMVLANPLKTTTMIEAGLDGPEGARRRPASRTVAYGFGVPYGGRLTSISGSPLAGLPVEVVETFAAAARPAQRWTVVRTAADGSFATRLGPGPSRRVEVAFAGSRTLSRSRGGGARLGVLSGVRMRASAATARIGGAAVIFSGRLEDLGAPMAAGGRPVELQFRLPRGEWSEFRTVQSDARGRFHYAYSFSDDDSRGVRFQFRAFVPAQDGWPYEPAGSKPVFVTGR
jgi:hypothetical protein